MDNSSGRLDDVMSRAKKAPATPAKLVEDAAAATGNPKVWLWTVDADKNRILVKPSTLTFVENQGYWRIIDENGRTYNSVDTADIMAVKEFIMSQY